MKRIFYLSVIMLIGLLPSAYAKIDSAQAERQIFDQLNQEREKIGLRKLQWDDHVADAAREHTKELAENEKLTHQFLGEATVPDRIGSTGARFTRSAENVARTEFLEDVHLALMNSPGHRANMMNPEYNAVGIGVIEHKGLLYVTQDFVLLVPVYSEIQFRDSLAEAFNRERKSRGLGVITARPEESLHDAACSTDGEAQNLSGKITGGATALVVFTASEPDKLPEQLLSRTTNSGFHRMAIGVCFRPDPQHGYANFWVVAAFYS